MNTMSADDFRRAACRDEDPELFHPMGREDRWDPATVKQAKAVCRRCPVRRQCDAWAASSSPAPQGITAGKTPGERRAARKRAAERTLLRQLLQERSGNRRKLYRERVPS